MPAEAMSAVTVVYDKPVEDWTAADRAQIVERLREFILDPKALDVSAKKKKRKKTA